MRRNLDLKLVVGLSIVVVLVACVPKGWGGPTGPTVTYDTSMVIGTQGVAGSPAVGFQGITGGAVVSPTPFQLGSFVDPVPAGYGSNVPLGVFTVTIPPAGSSTTYKDTPFLMTFKVDSVDGNTTAAQPSSFTIQGTLNGTVNSTGIGGLKATFGVFLSDTSFQPNFVAGGFTAKNSFYSLTVPAFQVSVDASPTPVSGVLVSASSIPEPSTLCFFLASALAAFIRIAFYNREHGARTEEKLF